MNITHNAIRLCSAATVLLAVAACGKQAPQQNADTLAPAPQAVPEAVAPPPPDLNQQLKDRLSQMGASSSERGWVVDLPSAHFKAGQTDFDPADAARIEQIASILKNRPEVQVLVQAYTDSRGSEPRNLELSTERANAVQQALISRGVDAARIRAEGRGEAEPIATNETAEGRERNRRVEIVFSDAEGRFASAESAAHTG
jgi:outer membrane protein OmpA-like peptidoglycan-associated protein